MSKYLEGLQRLYTATGGKAWEPKDVTGPGCKRLVEEGFAKFVDARCGFERMKDAMLSWTPSGHAAFGEKRSEA